MLRHRIHGLLLIGLAATAWVAACDSNDKDAPAAPADAGTGDATVPDGPDMPPVAFPKFTPPLFGYALEEAFPGTFLSGAMDMDWPAGAAEPFVLQRGGDIVRLRGGGQRDVVLDFESLVAERGEGGALGMALHPKFADPAEPKPYVYVWYNAEGKPTHQRLSRFTWNPATKVFDPASQLVMVEQTESAIVHNGAHIRFGPDGFLYFGNGDDTRTDETTQTLSGGLFSGIFRIDVDSRGGAVSHPPPKQPLNAKTTGYFIPNDNPFVGVLGAAEEIHNRGAIRLGNDVVLEARTRRIFFNVWPEDELIRDTGSWSTTVSASTALAPFALGSEG